MSHSEAARKTWEIENSILTLDPNTNALYNYSPADEKILRDSKPWARDKDLQFFKSVRISALALLKMVMHARSGGSIEVMGLMQGYVTSAGEVIVTDAFRLPVEGTETRVNAGDEANEYMSNFLELGRTSGLRPENAVGWYHSHPGYGCWLSGIDVTTQRNYQTFLDPFCAVVIDPDRTASAGKVEIGAFRTYPEGHKLADASSDTVGFAPIPQGKVEDFGKYASQYYSLDVQHFKSSLDSQLLGLLWNKYWVATLSQSPLLTNYDYATKQIGDLAIKTQHAARSQKPGGTVMGSKRFELDKEAPNGAIRTVPDPQLRQLVKTAKTIAQEEMGGLLAENVKEKLFFGVVEEARARLEEEEATENVTNQGVEVNG